MSTTATGSDIDILTPVLTETWDKDRSWSMATYERSGGFDGLR